MYRMRTVPVLVQLVRGHGRTPESHQKQQLVRRVDEGVHGLRAHCAGPAVHVRQELGQRDHQVSGQRQLTDKDR